MFPGRCPGLVCCGPYGAEEGLGLWESLLFLLFPGRCPGLVCLRPTGRKRAWVCGNRSCSSCSQGVALGWSVAPLRGGRGLGFVGIALVPRALPWAGVLRPLRGGRGLGIVGIGHVAGSIAAPAEQGWAEIRCVTRGNALGRGRSPMPQPCQGATTPSHPQQSHPSCSHASASPPRRSRNRPAQGNALGRGRTPVPSPVRAKQSLGFVAIALVPDRPPVKRGVLRNWLAAPPGIAIPDNRLQSHGH